nr:MULTISPECIES: hypothetical protein [Burkholderia]
MATTFFAGAAFLAATFLAGAAAFLATFFAEVAMFLLPGVVVGYTKRATCELQRRILQAPRRFVQHFYALSAGFPQVLLRAADYGCRFGPCMQRFFVSRAESKRRIMFDICIPILSVGIASLGIWNARNQAC